LFWFWVITKIFVVLDVRRLHLALIIFADRYSCVRETNRYRSLRRPTDERVMSIRFGYHGRLAGTYEKISFPACVSRPTDTRQPCYRALFDAVSRYFIMYSYFLLCHRKMAHSRRIDVWIALVSRYSKQHAFSNTCSSRIIRFIIWQLDFCLPWFYFDIKNDLH